MTRLLARTAFLFFEVSLPLYALLIPLLTDPSRKLHWPGLWWLAMAALPLPAAGFCAVIMRHRPWSALDATAAARQRRPDGRSLLHIVANNVKLTWSGFQPWLIIVVLLCIDGDTSIFNLLGFELVLAYVACVAAVRVAAELCWGTQAAPAPAAGSAA